MVAFQAEKMIDGFKQQLASQGIPFDQYVKMTGMTEEAMKADAMGPALEQLRMDLAVEAIVKAENLEVSDDEVEAEYKNLSEKYGMDIEMVKKYLPAEQIKEQVIREKVIKVVADSAKALAPAKEEEAEGEEKPAKKAPAKKTTKKTEEEK